MSVVTVSASSAPVVSATCRDCGCSPVLCARSAAGCGCTCVTCGCLPPQDSVGMVRVPGYVVTVAALDQALAAVDAAWDAVARLAVEDRRVLPAAGALGTAVTALRRAAEEVAR